MSRDDMEAEAAARLLETTDDDDIVDQQETQANDTPSEKTMGGTIDDGSKTSVREAAAHAAPGATASGAGRDGGYGSKAPSAGGTGGGGKDPGMCC